MLDETAEELDTTIPSESPAPESPATTEVAPDGVAPSEGELSGM